ncbi:MAG: hypothetical protein AAFR49_05820, partial [Pseudomonadota bacterium]
MKVELNILISVRFSLLACLRYGDGCSGHSERFKEKRKKSQKYLKALKYNIFKLSISRSMAKLAGQLSASRTDIPAKSSANAHLTLTSSAARPASPRRHC